jgi:hypothetical protein
MFSGLLLGTGAWYSRRCALNWKLKVTPYSRLLFQLQLSALRTEETGYGLLPTPMACEGEKNMMCSKQNYISNMARMGLLPTPRALMIEERLETYEARMKKRKDPVSPNLHILMLKGLLPTPTTQETPHYEAELTETGRRVASNGNSHSLNLADHAIRGLLPTPIARDLKGCTGENRQSDSVPDYIKRQTGAASQLNPLFVAEMMGFPPNWTVLPFQSGEEKA